MSLSREKEYKAEILCSVSSVLNSQATETACLQREGGSMLSFPKRILSWGACSHIFFSSRRWAVWSIPVHQYQCVTGSENIYRILVICPVWPWGHKPGQCCTHRVYVLMWKDRQHAGKQARLFQMSIIFMKK